VVEPTLDGAAPPFGDVRARHAKQQTDGRLDVLGYFELLHGLVDVLALDQRFGRRPM
jgi:hypothetical protein